MDSTHSSYHFGNEEVTLKHNNNKEQPRLFRPERFQHDERAEIPQTETYIREERTAVQPSPRDIQRQQQRAPQQFSETYVRDDVTPPAQDYSYDGRRDTLDSTFSQDSLLNAEARAFEMPNSEQEQVFGEYSWDEQPQPQPSAPAEVPIIAASAAFSSEAEIPAAMAEFDMDRRCNREVAEFSRRPSHRPIGRYIRDLALWRNTKDSAVIFAGGLALLLSLAYFSIISVLAYSSLSVLLLASGFVFLRQLVNTLQQKQGVPHPFQPLLERDVVIPPEYAHQQLDNILTPVNEVLVKLRNLYLADSLVQTLKLACFMYMLTYIGAWFNLLTLVTMVWVMGFTLPKLYMANRAPIDAFVGMIREHVRDLQLRVTGMFERQRGKFAAKRHSNIRAPTTEHQQSEKKVTIKRVEEKREKVL